MATTSMMPPEFGGWVLWNFPFEGEQGGDGWMCSLNSIDVTVKIHMPYTLPKDLTATAP